MTDLLKDTLTARAANAQPPDLDVDAIITTGDRRRRRRRTVSVIGVAMVILVVIAGGQLISHPNPPQPARTTPFTERRATYAAGSEIHYGPEVLSVAPYKICAFVQTDAGFVFSTEAGGIFVVDRNGVRRIKPDNTASLLTADNHGTLVGWVQRGTSRTFSVVYDVATDRELINTPVGNDQGSLEDPVQAPRVVAIDGDQAYFGTLHGLYRWNVRTNKGELIANVLPRAVRTVTAGQMVYQYPLRQPTTGVHLTVGPAPSDTTGRNFDGTEALLSPDATYLLTAPDRFVSTDTGWSDMRLFDVATGRGLSLRHPDHENLIPGQWLDNQTFSVAAVRRSSDGGAVDLLVCSAQSLTCKVITPAISTYAFDNTPPRTLPFTLPLGTPIYLPYR
jgi:hypothetical protein